MGIQAQFNVWEAAHGLKSEEKEVKKSSVKARIRSCGNTASGRINESGSVELADNGSNVVG